jgi:acyl-CoA reductase-like NAD-dependent aldehyde dehydrogenase
MELISINPSTEELIERFSPHSGKEVISIIDKSQKAFNKWRKISITKRKDFLKTYIQQPKNE